MTDCVLSQIEDNTVTADGSKVSYVGRDIGVYKLRVIFLRFTQKIIFIFHKISSLCKKDFTIKLEFT